MRVLVTPQRVELLEGRTFTVSVTVTNTGAVIGGYHIGVLGADPSWVTLATPRLSLFPDASETVTATIELPDGVGAGDRRIAIQVRELTPPQAISVTEIDLVVPPREALRMELSPMTVTCGKRGRFSVVAENTGNTAMSVSPVGLDPEEKIAFEFIPPILELAPGEHVITDLRTSAKRRWFGMPVVRAFTLSAVPPDEVESTKEAAAARAAAIKAAKKSAKQERRARRKAEKEEQRRADRDAERLLQRTDDGRSTTITDGARPGAGAEDGGTGTAGAGGSTSTATLAEAPPEPPEPLAQGVMVQKPRLGRGALSLLSLLLAVSVFAIVITIALSRLVGVSAADRDLALEVASARTAGAGSGSSVIGGTVKLLTDGKPAPGVTVEVFAAGDLTQPMISVATHDDGSWSVSSMPAGSYKLRFRGAGYAEVWYPNALDGADAKAVELDAGQKVTDLAVTLGGLPATISGQVKGADVAGALLTVSVPDDYIRPADEPDGSAGPDQSGSPPSTVTVAPLQPADGDATVSDADTSGDDGDPGAGSDGASPDGAEGAEGSGAAAATSGGVLRTVPLASDGMFALDDLPSPAVYELAVSKTGFETATQLVDLSGGESRTGVTLVLRTGDGSIAGRVTGPDGALGNAVVTATSGETTLETLTLTKGKVGEFRLRGLVTPATYTITVSAPGYSTVTSTLSLGAGQRLDNVLLSLAKSSASLSGMVTTVADGDPASGVAVAITSGSSEELTTVTQSGDTAGQWTAAGLPIPGTFTITFSRSDLQSQTVAVAVDSAGNITSGTGASGGIDVAMRSAFATVTGTVRQQTGSGTVAAGEATITLSSGEQTYTVTSASTPHDRLGHYEIGRVAPGTYTVSTDRKGTTPTTVIVTVTAGQVLTYNPELIQPASVSGVVTSDGSPLPGIEVNMYLSSQYPAEPYATTTTDSSGHYAFTGVDAPQAYVIEARSPSEGPIASDTIVLAASQAGVVDLAAGDS